MERDLGTEIEWVAAVHHNIEHPHVHIAVRGVDQEGRPLRLRGIYRAGLRDGRRNRYRSSGYRTPAHAPRGAAPRNSSEPLHISRSHPATACNDGSSTHFEVTVNPDDDALVGVGPDSPANTLRHGLCTFNNGPRQSVAAHKWCVQADFEKVLARYNRVATGKSCSRRMAHWFPTSASPSSHDAPPASKCGRPRTSPL